MRAPVFLMSALLAACGVAAPPRIEVTEQGLVLYRGEATTINRLIAAVRGKPGPAVVRASDNTCWMHVQWVLAALHEAGFERATLGATVVRLSSGYRQGKYDWPQGEDAARTAELLVTRDGIRTWAWTASGELPTRWAVSAAGGMPYEAVRTAIQALGSRDIELGLEALHPWDRDRLVLPAPPHDDPIPRWVISDLPLLNHYPVNLPLATQCLSDVNDDPDDRLVFTLTADGRILFKQQTLSLAEFAEQLVLRATIYESRLKRVGKRPYAKFGDGRKWSKLFVLLRVDRAASWGHVQWMLAELLDQRFFKLQFGAHKFPNTEIGARQAARAWAGREIRVPAQLDGKLSAFLATAHEQVGRISAAPETPFADIVDSINTYHAAGVDHLDFVGTSSAPAAVRRMKPLPTVRPK